MGNILGAAAKTKPRQKNKSGQKKGRNTLKNVQMHQSTFDEKHSFQSFGIVIFKHGEDLREGNTGMKKRDQVVQRMRGSGPSEGGGQTSP